MGALNFDLADRVFVVTGGSSGIGFATAAQLLAQGARVVVCARKADRLQAAARELDGGDRLLAIPAHIAKADEVARLFEQTHERFGRLDGLVNNVGMNLITSVVDADDGLWQKIIDSNLNGTFLCSRQAAQIMRARRAGRIVNISSIAARRSAPAMGIYGIAKAAIEMLTKVLAHELAPFDIQVNAVAPCMIRTPFSQPFWSNEDLHERIVAQIPLGRIGEPDDVALPVLFLLSSAAGFITGHCLAVDGGASAV